MAQYSRRSSLRHSFSKIILGRKSTERAKVGRLKGRHRFRAAVRLVREYAKWLATESPPVEEIDNGVASNVGVIRQTKIDKKLLTLEDRSTLLIHPTERSEQDQERIWEIFEKLRAFRKYSENSRKLLARVCLYRCITPGRVIVRQDRPAENLYFIADGEVNASRIETDKYTGDVRNIDMGSMSAGDMFGQVALLHSVPRTATIISKTTVELLLISRNDFDDILKSALTKEWNILRDALVHFNYFKAWDDDTVRKCCILSKIKDFKRDEIILGDGKGQANYVHFILDGECHLIEHILVRKRNRGATATYELLFDSDEVIDLSTRQRKQRSKTCKTSKMESTSGHLRVIQSQGDDDATEDDDDDDDEVPVVEYAGLLLPTMNPRGNERMDIDRTSIITTTLRDVVNEWHAITDVAMSLMRGPSVTSQRRYSRDVETVFMDICTFHRGTCFGLGEQMRNRRIVAATPVRCLLIPRYWLLGRNRANIWERVKLYMDSRYPSGETLLGAYVNDRKWAKYKRQLVRDVRKRTGQTPLSTNVTVHDVPYSTRIREGFDAMS